MWSDTSKTEHRCNLLLEGLHISCISLMFPTNKELENWNTFSLVKCCNGGVQSYIFFFFIMKRNNTLITEKAERFHSLIVFTHWKVFLKNTLKSMIFQWYLEFHFCYVIVTTAFLWAGRSAILTNAFSSTISSHIFIVFCEQMLDFFFNTSCVLFCALHERIKHRWVLRRWF